jgi:hypothetical protein
VRSRVVWILSGAGGEIGLGGGKVGGVVWGMVGTASNDVVHHLFFPPKYAEQELAEYNEADDQG